MQERRFAVMSLLHYLFPPILSRLLSLFFRKIVWHYFLEQFAADFLILNIFSLSIFDANLVIAAF